MDISAVTGMVLTIAGIADVLIARTLIAPRIRRQRQRERLVGVLTLCGVGLFGLGGLLLVGVIP